MVSKLRSYVDGFNQADEELYPQLIPNAQAADFLEQQIPYIECPSREIEEMYYFRWWTFRKHFKSTPLCGKRFTVLFDRDGSHYGQGTGIIVKGE